MGKGTCGTLTLNGFGVWVWSTVPVCRQLSRECWAAGCSQDPPPKVWCRLGMLLCTLQMYRWELHFPVCNGSVIVSAMTKGLFPCTTIPFVHRSEHWSHNKSVFLSPCSSGQLSCWIKAYEQAEGVTDVSQLRLSPSHTPSPPHLLVLYREFCRVLFTNKGVLILSGEG